MKTIIQKPRDFRLTCGKVLITNIFASAINVLSIALAFTEHNDISGRSKRSDYCGYQE